MPTAAPSSAGTMAHSRSLPSRGVVCGGSGSAMPAPGISQCATSRKPPKPATAARNFSAGGVGASSGAVGSAVWASAYTSAPASAPYTVAMSAGRSCAHHGSGVPRKSRSRRR